jgi:hypothetical protein
LLSLVFLMIVAGTCSCAGEGTTNSAEKERFMSASFQISSISRLDDRVWIIGRVLSGEIAAGDTLLAVGLAQTECRIQEVKVSAMSRAAIKGEEAELFLTEDQGALLQNGTQVYFALLEPGTVPSASRIQAELTWTSQEEKEMSPDSPVNPVIGAITEDTAVTLLFGDIKIGGTLLRKKEIKPLGGNEVWDLELERKIPLIPGYPFHLDIAGESVAMGLMVHESRE